MIYLYNHPFSTNSTLLNDQGTMAFGVSEYVLNYAFGQRLDCYSRTRQSIDRGYSEEPIGDIPDKVDYYSSVGEAAHESNVHSSRVRYETSR